MYSLEQQVQKKIPKSMYLGRSMSSLAGIRTLFQDRSSSIGPHKCKSCSAVYYEDSESEFWACVVVKRDIMVRRRLLLLSKPFDAYPFPQSNSLSRITNPKVLHHHENRCMVHKDAINFCRNILKKKSVDWEPIFQINLSKPIRDVDLVVTIGGDGTLLQACHFVDDSIPVLGLNSDPTQAEEVEEFRDEFDATRSTGFLCAATVKNFEQILDDILEGRRAPSECSRIAIRVNSELIPTYPLNDVLIAHPCPSTVSRFSFRIKKDDRHSSSSPLVKCRSSGVRVSTAAGSTAAMLSAGGFAMPILSKDLQYMVREPISPDASNLMHGVIKSGESILITWFCKEGIIYIDGSQNVRSIQYGDTVELSCEAPVLKLFLPHHVLSCL